MSQIAVETTGGHAPEEGRWHRLLKVGAVVLAVAIAVAFLDLVGVDVGGWFENLWDQIRELSWHTIVLGIALQTAQTTLAGLSYYGILRAAYPGEVRIAPIVTAYAVGVAMNGFLPANIGTFVTLMMFVALIPSCTVGGAIAAYLVQKIFYTIAGTFVYLYLFLSVPNSFDLNIGGDLKDHPVSAIVIVVGGAILVAMLARIFWRQVKKLWGQAKQGGVILTRPREYLLRAVLPSFLAWLCKLGVIAVFLAGFAIPVTFESVMWVTGSGSLANVASVTPGAAGVTQATNALALDTCCDVPRDTAVAYSTAQQLVITAWNVSFAILLVVLVFGWVGGKQLVGDAYDDAKERAADMKEQRKERKQAKREERRHRFGRRGEDAEEAVADPGASTDPT